MSRTLLSGLHYIRRRGLLLTLSPLSQQHGLHRWLTFKANCPYWPSLGRAYIMYSGSADKLEVAIQTMTGTFVLAIIILYLLMSALFRSFVDSLLVLLVIPLATVGGVIAIWLVNAFIPQPMDLLTMIGVNNAILLVHQTRAAERSGVSRRNAVEQAVRLRLRPILMSTLTSLFGMLPLLLNPGAGTELYRGLAAVIVGGLGVSTVFTLILLPSLLRLGESRPQRQPATTQPAMS